MQTVTIVRSLPPDTKSSVNRIIQIISLILVGNALLLYALAFPLRLAEVQAVAEGASTLYQTVLYTSFASEYLVILTGTGLGLFLLWKAQQNRVALLTAIMAVVVIGDFESLSLLPMQASDVWRISGLIHWVLANPITIFWLIVFPQGTSRPKWMRWLIPLVLLLDSYRLYLRFYSEGSPTPLFLLSMVFIGAGIGALIYNYRRHATPEQRQQIKWVVFGVVFVFVGLLLRTLLRSLSEAYLEPATALILENIFQIVLMRLSLIIVLASAFLAVTQRNLWDVDLTINRSLVYALATFITAFVFLIVFLLGRLLLSFVLPDFQNSLPLILAAFIVGAIFGRVQQEVRHFVDRRVFGFRFDLNQLRSAQQKPAIQQIGLLTGKKLSGFEVLGIIARGGMGEVYHGYNGQETVAIKVLPPDMKSEKNNPERFDRESSVLQKLHHPQIVKILDTGVVDNLPYMVLEYLEGQSLKEYMQDLGIVPLRTALQIIESLAAPLAYAHQQGVIHRDLKPSNIILRGNSLEAVLMDFGVAKLIHTVSYLTDTGIVGTIAYMAPEQIKTDESIDQRADIYALGLLLYEMLTGQVPFTGDPARILFAHLQQKPKDPRQLNPDIPYSIADAILCALAKEPDARFKTVTDFVKALRL